jgi:hypothetical protein
MNVEVIKILSNFIIRHSLLNIRYFKTAVIFLKSTALTLTIPHVKEKLFKKFPDGHYRNGQFLKYSLILNHLP